MAKWVELKSAQEVRDAQSIAHIFHGEQYINTLSHFQYALGPLNRLSDTWFEQDIRNNWSYRILVEEEE